MNLPERLLSKTMAMYPEPTVAGHHIPTFPGKIIVLDDDPTGTQTMHGVPVYMDWFPGTLEHAFAGDSPVVFILTNSRSFSAEKTREVHKEVAKGLMTASKAAKIPFLLISRSDSTLRGHWPLETATLRDTLEAEGHSAFDAEIICPFFSGGGRYTVEGVHYVAYGDTMVPAGESEFARDKTFGFTSSRLTEWVEEKTQGKIACNQVMEISLDDLKSPEAVCARLMELQGFKKVVVNALYQSHVDNFCSALWMAMAKGKTFMFRTAAPFVNALGGVTFRPILSAAEIMGDANGSGGLIVAGSHTQKTSEQLASLAKYPGVTFVNFDQRTALLDDETFENEISQASRICTIALKAGKTVVLSTSRQRVDLETGDPEDELSFAVKISKGLAKAVTQLDCSPCFVMGKGGITASDVATEGLKIRRAEIVGQAAPGVPVWRCGEESCFPGMGYVILPGNVGDEMLLYSLINRLAKGD
ncbi:MAG: hydroxyacid dehydrogenase [Defluviitaleaceae bacterium]|nr:hydroxyacid dehydrogenase [Defluviitaleaceae bacterium]